ncbi:MAG: hypothetical protein ACEPOZ_05380 [Marinifilaceae bacterium]
MARILDILYTLATVLIIVGALFILQDEFYGIWFLTMGIGLNVLYRGITLKMDDVKKMKWMENLRALNILFMLFALFSFYLDMEGRFSFLILAILLDFLLNLKDLSVQKKR